MWLDTPNAMADALAIYIFCHTFATHVLLQCLLHMRCYNGYGSAPIDTTAGNIEIMG